MGHVRISTSLSDILFYYYFVCCTNVYKFGMCTDFYSGAIPFVHVVYFPKTISKKRNTKILHYNIIGLCTNNFDYKWNSLMTEKSILVVHIPKYISYQILHTYKESLIQTVYLYIYKFWGVYIVSCQLYRVKDRVWEVDVFWLFLLIEVFRTKICFKHSLQKSIHSSGSWKK